MTLRSARAERVMARALDPAERLHAPHLLDVEVAQALRRLVQREEITPTRAQLALEDLTQIVIERHAHAPFLSRIWELRESLTAYDGAYVVLAEALRAPLLTCDGRPARAHGHRAKIELIDG